MAKKKKRVNGSRKGGAYERSICKRISLWLSDHTRDDLLWRTPGSGSRYTTAETRGRSRRRSKAAATAAPVAHAGDICATSEEAAWFVESFYFEAKSYASLDWLPLIHNKKSSNVYVWWQDTKLKAKRVERFPILICKENHRAELMGTTQQGFELLSLGAKGGTIPIRVAFPDRDLVFFNFNELLFLDAEKIYSALDAFDKSRGSKVLKLRKPR